MTTDTNLNTTESVVTKPKRGRPSKKRLAATKKIGRPKETTGRIAELKARLLATDGESIIKEIIRKALDPDDKDQIAALKMCVDRILPISMFEKAAGRSNAITINISTGEGSQTVVDGTTIDAEDATIVGGNDEEEG